MRVEFDGREMWTSVGKVKDMGEGKGGEEEWGSAWWMRVAGAGLVHVYYSTSGLVQLAGVDQKRDDVLPLLVLLWRYPRRV